MAVEKQTYSVVNKKTGEVVIEGVTFRAASKTAIKEASKAINVFQVKDGKGRITAIAQIKVNFID